METLTLNTEMIVVLGILAVTVFLFVTETFRIDFTAVLVMVALGFLSQLPGLENLASIDRLFEGFSSNAVMSIIAVMIIGAGLDKTGLMSKVASWIVKIGGKTEARLIPIISGTVGVISSFMQNVGAAALFLPVVSRISVRTEIPMSRLLMPMGFCAILGGTITMVGSSPLILLNDLIVTSNETLLPGQQMQTFELFDVTPVGISLVLTGILYFVIFGRWVLPSHSQESATSGQSIRDYMRGLYGVDTEIFEVILPENSPFEGRSIADVMIEEHLHIIGTHYRRQSFFMPPPSTTTITTPCRLAVLGNRADAQALAKDGGGRLLPQLEIFADDYAPTACGMAEVVVPPGSDLVGHCVVDLEMRKIYGLSLVAIRRGEETLSLVETEDHKPTRVGLVPLETGDTLVVFAKWDRLAKLTSDRNFVVVTQDFPREDVRPQKVGFALGFFAMALALILFSDIRLSLCLLGAATGMILSGVLRIEEAYNAVSWSTVFLLASLIPLGQAVQNTGTAAWIAQETLRLFDGVPVFGLQVGVALLATAFTLVMSNVGATVLLVPLAVSIAVAAGGDPAIFALTVAVATSNSFLIPTHQVNALIMAPGGYKVTDFIRSGSIMTVLFLIVSLCAMALFV
ncbi:MAG: SLC13 family permease [Pseudomonadota bacterium]